MKKGFAYLVFLVGTVLLAPVVHAGIITSDDIIAFDSNIEGSGNGQLDLTMFVDAGGGGVTNNEYSEMGSLLFNGDDANTAVAKGTETEYAESYITTAGDLKAFYDLTFGDGSAGSGASLINEIVIFLDFNENEAGNNLLSLMDVILNPLNVQGSPDPSGDVPSGKDVGDPPPSTDPFGQNYINQVFTDGMLLATLDAPKLLPLNEQGAGFADYAIFTGIDPYLLNNSDTLLFNQSISLLSNGGETKYLSGDFSGDDITDPTIPVPEPSVLAL